MSSWERLKIGHKSDAFDHAGIERDKNLALPLDRLRELKTEELIGSLSERHVSRLASTAQGRKLF
jgi:D-proline reductase (dithiol) PrdB